MIRIGIQRGLCDLPDQTKEIVVPPVKECADSVKGKDEEIRNIKLNLEGVSAELVKQKKLMDDERQHQNQELSNEKNKVKNQANEIQKRIIELENCRKQLEEE